MYKKHFGFSEAPFSIAPNPRYLFLSERHREALAHLLYGLGGNGGFILLTGEVGTGKTTVCRCLLEQLPDNTDVAFVLNPRLSVLDMLATVCDEFGLDYQHQTPSNKVFVDLLSQFLLESHAGGRQALLIIDEAQNLSFEVLEELRLLTNLETDSRKLLQILLLGQPELQQMLRETRLRQLNQRVIARYHLQPLSRQELAAYVPHRLRLAGGSERLIPPKVFKALYGYSGGIPRLINLICDRALLGTYAAGLSQVNASIIQQAAFEVLGKPANPWQSPARQRALLIAAGALLSISLLGLAYWLFTPAPTRPEPVLPVPIPAPAATSTSAPAPVIPVAAPVAVPAPVAVAPTPEPAKPPPSTAVAATPETAPTKVEPPAVVSGWPPLPEQLTSEQNLRVWTRWLALWGKTWDGRVNACDWALSQQLVCVRRSGSLGTLRWYNRPALLELRLPGGQSFNLLLVRLDGARAQVWWHDALIALDVAQLEALWLGEFRLLLPQIPLKSPPATGQVSPTNAWLDTELARLLQVPALGVDQFSPELEQRLRQFQNREGLTADGIAGSQTLLLLAARVLDGPHLSPTSGEH